MFLSRFANYDKYDMLYVNRRAYKFKTAKNSVREGDGKEREREEWARVAYVLYRLET